MFGFFFFPVELVEIAYVLYKRMERVNHGMIYLAYLLQERCGFVVRSWLYEVAMVSLTADISTTEKREMLH